MVYLGSKRKIAKQLLELMLSVDPEGDMPWVEPFVGGANVIDKVPPTRHRIGADCNPYLIALWQKLQQGWEPPKSLTFSEYLRHKAIFKADATPQEDLALAGWYGFVGSFKGKFMDGFVGEARSGRDYCGQQARNVLKQLPYIQTVEFICTPYNTLTLPTTQCIIYCDPPYQHQTTYRGTGVFDHTAFWQWCRTQRAKGHIVFISECTAPTDFTVIAEFAGTCTLSTGQLGTPTLEKLFTLL